MGRWLDLMARDCRGEAYIAKNSVVLRRVSTAHSVAIWLYPARILGWIQKGGKLPFVMIPLKSMESRHATDKARVHRSWESG
jgi:hypothetical protein